MNSNDMDNFIEYGTIMIIANLLSVCLSSCCSALFLIGLMYPEELEKRKLLQSACLLMIIDELLTSCSEILMT